MNYSEMSDFEINCEVLAVTEPDVAHMQLSADQKSFYHCGYDGNAFHEITIPDYCNSWADAGPVIEQYGIGIMPLKRDLPKAWDISAGLLSNTDCKHENILRAAMIVFLMKQEKANA